MTTKDIEIRNRTSSYVEQSEAESHYHGDRLSAIFSELCEKIVGEKVSVSASMKGRQIILNADSHFLASKMKNNNKFSMAMDLLAREMTLSDKEAMDIMVDSMGVRQEKMDKIRERISKVTDAVIEKRKPIIIKCVEYGDRETVLRIIKNTEGIRSREIGYGEAKRTMVLPITEDIS